MMFPRFTTRAGLLAGAVSLSLSAPAAAASVEWQAGPIALAAGQVAQVGIGNPDLFSCSVGVRIFAGPASRITPTVNTGALALVVDTFSDPGLVPARGVHVVGYTDPNLMLGKRRLLLVRGQTVCGGVPATQMKGGPGVTLQISDPNLAQTTAVLAATPR
jgi:hypothetical protein